VLIAMLSLRIAGNVCSWITRVLLNPFPRVLGIPSLPKGFPKSQEFSSIATLALVKHWARVLEGRCMMPATCRG
jgi:hypothetical protein